jgi:hypothetical protein
MKRVLLGGGRLELRTVCVQMKFMNDFETLVASAMLFECVRSLRFSV